MLKLKSITMRNWLRVREAKVDFPDAGVVVVVGQNNTQFGHLESVGSGKTALGEAISRTLLGVSGRYTDYGHYSLNQQGDTYLRVEAMLGARRLVVESGFRCDEFDGTGAGLRFQIDDQAPIERPRVAQTRKELSEIIGLDPEVAPWTVFLDGEQLKFNKLGQAEALALLMQALNQPPWQVFYDKALKKSAVENGRVAMGRQALDREHQARAASTSRIEQLTADLAEAENSYQWAKEAHTNAVATHNTRIAEAEKVFAAAAQKSKDIQTELKKVQQADAEAFGRLELERVRTVSDQSAAERSLSAWQAEVYKRQTASRDADRELKALTSDKTCPTCKKPMDVAHPEDIEKAKTAAASLRKLLTDGQKTLAECETYLGEVRTDLATIAAAQGKLRSNKVDQLSEALTLADETSRRADRALRAAQDDKARLALPSETAVVSTRAYLAEAKTQLSGAETKVLAATRILAEAEHDQRLAAYWVRGFSPAGIPNLILRRTVDPLNDAARIISNALTGGTLAIQFAAESELASGESRPKLVTTVTNRFGASNVQGNSKGEAGLVNLIIVETQAQVGRVLGRVGYRWFDEAVNSQDAVVRRNFYGYLREQARSRGILTFIVDHHTEAANFADHTLIARKGEDGFTSYHWK